ncbi:MAG TPA: hypothetical protein ACFYD1_06970, partial [Candidatus Hypogeohydataceae bacterium YC38]
MGKRCRNRVYLTPKADSPIPLVNLRFAYLFGVTLPTGIVVARFIEPHKWGNYSLAGLKTCAT